MFQIRCQEQMSAGLLWTLAAPESGSAGRLAVWNCLASVSSSPTLEWRAPQLWTVCGARLESLGACRLRRKAVRWWNGAVPERALLSPLTGQLSREAGKSRSWLSGSRPEALPEPAP